MNGLFLFLTLPLATSLGGIPNKNSSGQTNVDKGMPVSVTSSIPEGGGERALDTTLTFTKTNPGDTTEYFYAISSNAKLLKPFAMLMGMPANVSYEMSKMVILSNFAEWQPIDFSSPKVENLGTAFNTFNIYLKLLNRLDIDSSISLWVTKKNANGDIDLDFAYDPISSFNYTAGITDYCILPDYKLEIGQTPIKHYDHPTNQYSVDFTWFKNGTKLEPTDVIEEAGNYKAEFTLTPNPSFKPMFSLPYYMTVGFLDNMFEYNDIEEKYAPQYSSFLFPLTSANKETIVSGTYLDIEKNIQNYTLFGKYNACWKQTTYSSEGFGTFIYEGEDVTQGDNYKEADLVVTNTAAGTDIGSFNVKTNFNHLYDDNVLQVNYTVTNKANAAKTFSLGSTADIQIGADDKAICYPFTDGSGFKMVSNNVFDIDTKGNHAQLNFYCQNTKNVTDVDRFWYGAYSKSYIRDCTEAHKPDFLPWRDSTAGYWGDAEKKCVFLAEEKNRLSANDKSRWLWETDPDTGVEAPHELDSAMAWSWNNRTLQPGESKTYSVLFSIGGPGSENIVGGDFTNIRTPNDTITYSGEENFNVTKIEVNGTALDASCYTVDVNNKTITFNESANLKPDVKVNVFLNNNPVAVRNTITPKGPSLIRMILNDESTPIDIKEGNNKVFLNEDGTPSEDPTNRFVEYNSLTGKVTLQNVPTQNQLILPFDITSPNGEIDIKVVGENTINNIKCSYPVTFTGNGANDKLNAQNINTSKLNIDRCKCTINATGTSSCIDSANEINVNNGTLTLVSEAAGITTKGGDLKITGPVSINAKTGIDNLGGSLVLDGDVEITASECGINCDTLSLATLGNKLTINMDASKALKVKKLVPANGYQVTGGTVDADGHFIPEEGATKVTILRTDDPVPPVPPTPSGKTCITHWVLLGLAVALIGFVLILWLLFKIRNFKDKKNNEINVAPIVGFAVHFAAVIITAIVMHCLICYILLGVNLAILAGAIILYALYKEKDEEKDKDPDEKQDKK